MGKEIAGSGMDLKVINRCFEPPDPTLPKNCAFSCAT